MTIKQIDHIVPEGEAAQALNEALAHVATEYQRLGAQIPADLYVAQSLIQHGVFGSPKQMKAQVHWVRLLLKSQTSILENIEERKAQGVVVTAKPAPRKRAAKKTAAKKPELQVVEAPEDGTPMTEQVVQY